MRESAVESYFKRRVKEAGGLARKWVSPGRRGVNDQIVGFAGARFAFVELKRPGKKAEDHQIREHNRWRELGFAVRVIDTKEGVDAFIQEMTK